MLSSEINVPEWFRWLKTADNLLASKPNKEPGGNALRVFISAPNVDFAQWAIVSGAFNAEKYLAPRPKFGDRVVSGKPIFVSPMCFLEQQCGR